MTRSKNLGDGDILTVVKLIDGWSGPLTWKLLIAAVEKRLFNCYTRAALHKHARIAKAFSDRKLRLSEADDREERQSASPELHAANQRIDRLEAENQRLDGENNRLLEQFVRWTYNAGLRGLDHAYLSRPLPPVNRDRTKEPKR